MIDLDEYIGDRADFRRWAVELFALFNLAFLTVDVYMAHAANEFAVELEWVPVFFSALAPLLLIPSVIRRSWDRGLGWWLGLFVGASSVLVGIAGMILHLESTFFLHRTLKSLVYAAPFVAPLSYAGIGLLLILNRLEHDDWGRWIVFLAFAGFVGNFGLSLLDHAQNGFFDPAEWIPVVAAGFGVGFLGAATAADDDRTVLEWSLWVMGLQVAVGLLGFGLHLAASLAGTGPTLWYKLIYGAPIFAPLLFPNLALLAAIGLWECLGRRPSEHGDRASE